MLVQFLFNTSRKTVVTYDDTYSLGDKAAFAKNNGMAGCFTWSLDQVCLASLRGDHTLIAKQDDGYNLQNAIRSALGK
jgi:chitinase